MRKIISEREFIKEMQSVGSCGLISSGRWK
jgi:hypothetical protein